MKKVHLFTLLITTTLLFALCVPKPPTFSCSDGTKNGNETGEDCGGPDCPPCPTCFDLQKNGNESGIDCGGNCSPCHGVITNHELLIRDLAVVNKDEFISGELSFGHLLRRMAFNDQEYKQVVLSLIETWDKNQTVNGFNISSRPTTTKQTKDQWKSNQGLQNDFPDENWNPDPTKAPFRLLAVTNRVDLKQVPNNAGEGRLTFGQADGGENDFTLIFEYKLPGSTEKDVIQWAKRWHQLSNMALGSDQYMDTLTSIILDFTRDGNDLGQIRTNSVQGGPWEFRELKWNDSNKKLEETTRKQNPSTTQLDRVDLAAYLNNPTHSAELLNGDHNIKETFNSVNILAGDTQYSNSFTWSVMGVDQNILDVLDEISCTGCHGGFSDPNGIGFTHIKPRSQNTISSVSSFLQVKTDFFRKDSLESLLKLELPLTTADLEVARSPETQRIIDLINSMKVKNATH